MQHWVTISVGRGERTARIAADGEYRRFGRRLYRAPAAKRFLPHRAVAKIDLRLVPDMKATDALAALKAHLAKHGFGDIEVNMTGGYDPTSTSADSALIQAQLATVQALRDDPADSCREAPARILVTFSPANRCNRRAGHFGLGHGSGAHAPDEYYVIESANPNIQGMDGAVRSYVDYLYEMAR